MRIRLQSRSRFQLALILALSTLSLAPRLELRAATWFGGTGNWDEMTNWIPMQVPGGGDEVFIDSGIARIFSSSGSQDARIAGVVGSFAAVEVKSVNGFWVNSSFIFLGDADGATGQLTVDDGGSVSCLDFGIGAGMGEIFVSNGGTLSVRSLGIGNGVLRTESGGQVTGVSFGVGGAIPSRTGDALVTGTGSEWRFSGAVGAGGGTGDGTITVNSGATVESGMLLINHVPGVFPPPISGSSVTIDGDGSSWTSSGTVFVDSTGVLKIQNGGEFTTTGDVQVLSEGSLIATGDDSQLSVGGSIAVGGSGIGGNIVVMNGAIANSMGATRIAQAINETGTVTISGAGSHWTNSGIVTVGGQGTAKLSVSDGGTITADSVNVVSPSNIANVLHIDGGDTPETRGILETTLVTALNAKSQVQFDGGILRATADSTDFIRGAPIINARGAFIDTNGFTVGIGAVFSGLGGLTKLGAGTLALNFPAIQNYAGATTVEQGTLQLAFGFPSTTNSLPVQTHLVMGNASDTGSATLDLHGFDQEIGALSSDGTTMSRVVTNSAALKTLTVNQFSNTVYGGQLTGNLNLTKLGLGTLTLTGENTYSGSTTINGGTLKVDGTLLGNVHVNAGGTLSGNGAIFGLIDNAGGTVSPGASPGTLHVGGDYTQSASGRLMLEIAGPTAGTDYDVLDVTGSIMLLGMVDVALVNGYVPTGETQFDLLKFAGTIDVSQATFNFLGAPDGTQFTPFTQGGIFGLTILAPPTNLPGDYNEDHVVDAADYTVWRDRLGQTASLPNDDTPGVGPDDYTRWKSHFGESAGDGEAADSNTAVPEPATLVLLIFAATGWCLWRGRSA